MLQKVFLNIKNFLIILCLALKPVKNNDIIQMQKINRILCREGKG
jgi:hypothetical protein